MNPLVERLRSCALDAADVSRPATNNPAIAYSLILQEAADEIERLLGIVDSARLMAEAAREAVARGRYQCKARASLGANDPQDCDWPLCGCDPHADKVIETLNEGGFYVVPSSGDNREMTEAAEAVDREWHKGCECAEDYANMEYGHEYFMYIYEAMVERSQKP